MKDADLIERFVSKKIVWEGKAIDFRVDTVRLPNGKLATREFIDHPGAVAVVPFLDARTVIMVEQYRHPVGEVTLEIPAGKLDPKETLLTCVRRELREETGFAAAKIKPLLSFWPTSAFNNEELHIYVAEGLRAGKMKTDEDEFLRCVKMPFRTVLNMVLRGKIKDAKTMVAIMSCALRRRLY